jgi:hypothetical protein
MAVAGSDAVFRSADIPARRHFRAGIGCDDRDVGQAGRGRRRLGQADWRTAAEDNEAVGLEPLDVIQNAVKSLARHVLTSRVAKPDATVRDRRDELARQVGARRRAQHDQSRNFVPIDFIAQRGDAPGAENDPHRIGAIGEGLNHDF